MIDLYKFMSADKVNTLRSTGLNKIAAALEYVESGREIEGGEMHLHTAIQLLGEKAFEKRAAFFKIARGLQAYRALRGEEKTAAMPSEVAGSILWAPLATAIGGGIGAGKPKLSKKELKEQGEHGIANVLIPGYGAHNLARRLKSE